MRILRLLPLLAATGCDGGLGSRDEIADAKIEAMKEIVTVLEGIKDMADVGAAKPRVGSIMERMAELDAAAKELGEPGAEDRNRIREKFAAARKEIEPRMEKARERLQGDPDAMVAVSRMMLEAVVRMGN